MFGNKNSIKNQDIMLFVKRKCTAQDIKKFGLKRFGGSLIENYDSVVVNEKENIAFWSIYEGSPRSEDVGQSDWGLFFKENHFELHVSDLERGHDVQAGTRYVTEYIWHVRNFVSPTGFEGDMNYVLDVIGKAMRVYKQPKPQFDKHNATLPKAIHRFINNS